MSADLHDRGIPHPRPRTFALTAAVIFGLWGMHNLLLLPLEKLHLPDRILEPALVVARLGVWFAPVGWYLARHGIHPAEAFALRPTAPSTWERWALLPGLIYLAGAAALVGSGGASAAHALGPGAIVAFGVGILFEELLMRGFVFGELSRWWAARWVILGTAALFAGMHIPGWLGQGMAPEMIAPSFGVLLALGLVLGVARWGTSSVWPPVAIHLLNNLLALWGG